MSAVATVGETEQPAWLKMHNGDLAWLGARAVEIWIAGATLFAGIAAAAGLFVVLSWPIRFLIIGASAGLIQWTWQLAKTGVQLSPTRLTSFRGPLRRSHERSAIACAEVITKGRRRYVRLTMTSGGRRILPTPVDAIYSREPRFDAMAEYLLRWWRTSKPAESQMIRDDS